MNRFDQRLTLGTAAVLLGACGGGAPTAPPPPPPPPPAASYSISLEAATVAVGGTVPRTAIVRDGSGNVVSATVTWASSNESIATVTPAGLVAGIAAGSMTLRATANGATGSTTIVVADLAFTALHVGSRSACARTAGGPLNCWGNNGPGVIGSLGDDQVCYVDLFCSTTPRVGVTSPLFTQVTMGESFACGLTAAGVAWCWGRNDLPYLGAISSETCQIKTAPIPCSHTPLLVEGGHTFTALSVGSNAQRTCGLSADGTAWCWGGLYPTGNSRIPVAVPGGLAFTSVVTGSVHACGLTAAGTAYCWGSSELGPIGTGGPDSPSPAPVTGGLVFASLAASYDHTCGLTSAGAAYCWGANAAGQLGDGTATTRKAPTAVLGGLAFATISAGYNHTCGVTGAGAAWCWGANRDGGDHPIGQLGDGTTISRLTPVAVLRGLAFAEVYAARHFTCGRTTIGRIYCWGGNRFGNLGIGTHGDFDLVATPVGLGGLP